MSFNTNSSSADEITTPGKLVVNAGGSDGQHLPDHGRALASGPITLLSYGSRISHPHDAVSFWAPTCRPEFRLHVVDHGGRP